MPLKYKDWFLFQTSRLIQFICGSNLVAPASQWQHAFKIAISPRRGPRFLVVYSSEKKLKKNWEFHFQYYLPKNTSEEAWREFMWMVTQ